MNVTTKIGVVVPAHNEARLIAQCLESIRTAAKSVSREVDVAIFVVCDGCTDRTAEIVRQAGLDPIEVNARNVGIARALGADAALAEGADWLSFTDADTRVSPTWLVDQLALRADAFCGTVGIDDWGVYGDVMRSHFDATYTDADGHRHIHGANLGISARSYRAVGGFPPLPSSEDVALVNALVAANLNIAWSAVPRVLTSARANYRAPSGFGATLERVAATFRSNLDGTRELAGEALA